MNDARPRGKDAEKYKVLDEMLTEEYVLAHINTQKDGVSLPTYLMAQPTVTLKLSRFFRKPVLLGKETIRADLLFDGEYFPCSAPWKALWGVTSPKGDGKVWPDAVPDGVLQELAKVSPEAIKERRAEQAAASAEAHSATAGKNTASRDTANSSAGKPAVAPQPIPEKAGRPQLRRVK